MCDADAGGNCNVQGQAVFGQVGFCESTELGDKPLPVKWHAGAAEHVGQETELPAELSRQQAGPNSLRRVFVPKRAWAVVRAISSCPWAELRKECREKLLRCQGPNL